MPNIALVPAKSTSIPILEAFIDGYPDVSHRLALSTGDAPLENGATITDHAIALPVKLELSGWVSDLKAGVNRAGTAWGELQRLNKATEPVQVITPWGVYNEMMILDINATQRAGGMQFSLSLEAIQRVGVNPPGAVGATATGPAAERQSGIERGRVRAAAINAVVDIIL